MIGNTENASSLLMVISLFEDTSLLDHSYPTLYHPSDNYCSGPGKYSLYDSNEKEEFAFVFKIMIQQM